MRRILRILRLLRYLSSIKLLLRSAEPWIDILRLHAVLSLDSPLVLARRNHDRDTIQSFVYILAVKIQKHDSDNEERNSKGKRKTNRQLRHDALELRRRKHARGLEELQLGAYAGEGAVDLCWLGHFYKIFKYRNNGLMRR